MTKQEFINRMEVMNLQGLEMFKAMFNELEFEKEATEKISVGSDVFKEIVEQVAEEVQDGGTDIIDDYELEMYSNEVTISDLTLSRRKLEQIISSVMLNYFVEKS